jgi:hypothetical protein
MLLMCFLNDFEMVPVAPITAGINLAFTFHMRCISIVRLLLLLLLLLLSSSSSSLLICVCFVCVFYVCFVFPYVSCILPFLICVYVVLTVLPAWCFSH